MPEARVELARGLPPADFESAASAIPPLGPRGKFIRPQGQRKRAAVHGVRRAARLGAGAEARPGPGPEVIRLLAERRGPPLVSVIVPAYNAERFVQPALRSILAQTVTDLEVVVVDDGSTDGTLAAARSIGDSRVRVLTGPNRGVSHARNRGIAAALPSPYVAFLDADDLWDPAKLAVQLAFLEARPEYSGVGCRMRYVSARGNGLGVTGQDVDAVALGQIARGELYPFPTSSLVVRRDALARAGGFDESFRWGAEDLDLYARLVGEGPLGCVPAVLGSYRIHPASAMARYRLYINAEARFARARIAARARGVELSRDEFLANHRPSWADRRQDLVEVLYRSAALAFAERRPVRACAYGALALLVNPRYTARRLHRQRFAAGQYG
jgi:glycosyltransferase involved in cell wall biosynthesis